MAHVSRAAIDSCRSALQAWSEDRRRWGEDSGTKGTTLPKSASQISLTHSQGSDKRKTETFVPYTIQNLLAEPLLLITEEGVEHRIESQHWIELSYAQVWGRGSELSKYARDSNDAGINNMVCLQLASARQIFGSVSIEVEQTVAFEIEPQSAETGTPALLVSTQLHRRNGQKFLRISSMVSIRNCTQMPLASAVLGAEDATPVPMGTIPVLCLFVCWSQCQCRHRYVCERVVCERDCVCLGLCVLMSTFAYEFTCIHLRIYNRPTV